MLPNLVKRGGIQGDLEYLVDIDTTDQIIKQTCNITEVHDDRTAETFYITS